MLAKIAAVLGKCGYSVVLEAQGNLPGLSEEVLKSDIQKNLFALYVWVIVSC